MKQIMSNAIRAKSVLGFGCILLLAACAADNIKHSPRFSMEDYFNKGNAAFQQADYSNAMANFKAAADLAREQKDSRKQADGLVRLSAVYLETGRYAESLTLLHQASALLDQHQEKTLQAAVLQGMGQAYQALGDNANAMECFQKALAWADQNKDMRLQAALRNNIGNLLAGDLDFPQALENFSSARESAKSCGEKTIIIKADLNAARIYYETKQYDLGIKLVNEGMAEIISLKDGRGKIFDMIALAKMKLKLHEAKANLDKAVLNQICELLNQCKGLARSNNDTYALTYVYGEFGALYEKFKRLDDALSFTRQAIFYAQNAHANAALMQWHWQAGRILKTKGEIDSAIDAYNQAIISLEATRNDLFSDCKSKRLSFRETVGPLYFETADLILSRARVMAGEAQQSNLLAAREIIEKLKTAELQDYYQDECVTYLQSRIVGIEEISTNTAVLYPIMLPDRIELLLCQASGLKQITIPHASVAFNPIDSIRAFRKSLEQFGSREYQYEGQRLYNLIIKPFEAELRTNQIQTLIFVPDGALRTIPIAALFDGENFLIERYAVVTTPGLTLTDPHTIKRDEIKVLLAGLTEAVQDAPALPSVAYELESINQLYECRILLDKTFTFENINESLNQFPYPIIHIASHGQFDKDPENTFLLTYDGKIRMEDLDKLMGLSQFRKEPVELLCLSACQTALGDDRAALGLAGVSLKAGARSAVASLWFVDDKATSEMTVEFYRRLKDSSITKAEALRISQIKLLKQEAFSHPAFWAPFLLIGNWL